MVATAPTGGGRPLRSPMLASTHLAHAPSDLIAGKWVPIPGSSLRSFNPARPDQVVFECGPIREHVDQAIQAARAALPAWSATPRERRFAVLRRFAELAKQHAPQVAEIICDEVGKVMWECKGEASLLAGKVDITLETSPNNALSRVTPFDLELSASRRGACNFRPHGVMAVLGPFNFPAHLPNGHIIPALALGNTIVFKPSDKAPATGQKLAELFDQALRDCGAPAGVVNLVQGGAAIAAHLVAHPDLDAIALTGSWGVARKILEANLDRPGRLIALELGGSNPAIVMPDADLRQAAIEITRCAFNTTGQRCTSTRRAIIHEAVAPKLIKAIAHAASQIAVGPPRSASPTFMGPIISDAMLRAVHAFQARAARAGAEVLVESTVIDAPWTTGGHYLTPSLIRVPRFTREPADLLAQGDIHPGADEEIFGPLLRVAIVKDLDEALEQANATRYGLAASIFTREPAAVDRFLHEVRAGCLNVNTGTAGASSKLPFGGTGLSGNHRPAGSFALDYCAYPVASMVENSNAALLAEGMRFEDAWLR